MPGNFAHMKLDRGGGRDAFCFPMLLSQTPPHQSKILSILDQVVSLSYFCIVLLKTIEIWGCCQRNLLRACLLRLLRHSQIENFDPIQCLTCKGSTPTHVNTHNSSILSLRNLTRSKGRPQQKHLRPDFESSMLSGHEKVVRTDKKTKSRTNVARTTDDAKSRSFPLEIKSKQTRNFAC